MEGYILSLKRIQSFSVLQPNQCFLQSDFEYFWLVLDRQELQFFEDIDLINQVEVNKLSTVSIKNAKIEKLAAGQFGTQNGLLVVGCDDKNIALFECVNAQSCYKWLTELNIAATLHCSNTDRAGIVTRCCEELKIEPTSALSKSLISRAYKRRALESHPDKGGSVKAFQAVKEAYLKLLEIQAQDRVWQLDTVIRYDVVIEKMGNGVGLGIDIYEDLSRGQILVQHVDKACSIITISPESGGSIQPGDVLVGIDHDDCSMWFMSRVASRLNGHRAPVGTKVLLKFKRRDWDVDPTTLPDIDANTSNQTEAPKKADDRSRQATEVPAAVPTKQHEKGSRQATEVPAAVPTKQHTKENLEIPQQEKEMHVGPSHIQATTLASQAQESMKTSQDVSHESSSNSLPGKTPSSRNSAAEEAKASSVTPQTTDQPADQTDVSPEEGREEQSSVQTETPVIPTPARVPGSAPEQALSEQAQSTAPERIPIPAVDNAHAQKRVTSSLKGDITQPSQQPSLSQQPSQQSCQDPTPTEDLEDSGHDDVVDILLEALDQTGPSRSHRFSTNKSAAARQSARYSKSFNPGKSQAYGTSFRGSVRLGGLQKSQQQPIDAFTLPSWKDLSTLSSDDEIDPTLLARDVAGKIALWRGDITSLKVDAIVTDAIVTLLGGRGVDGESRESRVVKRKEIPYSVCINHSLLSFMIEYCTTSFQPV